MSPDEALSELFDKGILRVGVIKVVRRGEDLPENSRELCELAGCSRVEECHGKPEKKVNSGITVEQIREIAAEVYARYGPVINHRELLIMLNEIARISHRNEDAARKNPVMTCALDGNALCIKGPGFINLQESPAMFIELSDAMIEEFNKLKGAR